MISAVQTAGTTLKLQTRVKIIAWEVVGLGAFLAVLAYLLNSETRGGPPASSFAWVFGLLGAVFILVGLELASLVKQIQTTA